MLTEDFTFFFPSGKWHGEHEGRNQAKESFAYVSQVFPESLPVRLDRVTASDTTAVFEFRDEGRMALPTETRDYRNRVAISLEVRGEKICGYHEYFGSDGKSY